MLLGWLYVVCVAVPWLSAAPVVGVLPSDKKACVVCDTEDEVVSNRIRGVPVTVGECRAVTMAERKDTAVELCGGDSVIETS